MIIRGLLGCGFAGSGWLCGRNSRQLQPLLRREQRRPNRLKLLSRRELRHPDHHQPPPAVSVQAHQVCHPHLHQTNITNKKHHLMRTRILISKHTLTALLLAGGFMAVCLVSTSGQDARFFRIAGPVATRVTGMTADGTITWTNAPTNATFTVTPATALHGPSNWVDYVRVPASNAVTVQRIFDRNPPTGMVLIPAGSFTMGNCMDPAEGDSDELPLHTVYVSAFYMDANLVSYSQWQTVYN